MGWREVRRFMKKVLTSHKFHVSVVVLVIVDCFVLIAELVIDHLEDALNESIGYHATKSVNHLGNHTSPISMVSSHIEHKQTGFGAWGPFFHMLEELFKFTSFTILSIFMVEIILKLIFIPRTFCKVLEIFDAFIVVSSFTLKILLFHREHRLHSITGLITLLR